MLPQQDEIPIVGAADPPRFQAPGFENEILSLPALESDPDDDLKPHIQTEDYLKFKKERKEDGEEEGEEEEEGEKEGEKEEEI